MLPKIKFWLEKQYVMDIRFFLFILSITNRVELRPTTKALDQLAGGQMEWEAWLLIHESRPKSGDEMLKRITPKSIFTVRPFSPDILPPCAEGYRSDAMGRCINVVKIDSQSHLGYLVDKLNSMYDSDDYEDDTEEEDPPTTGPLQFSIPFGDVENDSSHNNSKKDLSVSTSNSNDFNMSEIDYSNVKLIGTNFTNMNNSLNVIPLRKNIDKNITSTMNNETINRPLERNTTVLSFLGSLIHDQPIIQDPQSKDHNTIKSTTVNITNIVSEKVEEEEKTETIIILFHPLPNGTSQNKTHSVQNESLNSKSEGTNTPQTTTNDVSTVPDQFDSSTVSSTEKPYKDRINTNSPSNNMVLTQSNIHPSSNIEINDDDEFRRDTIFSFLHNADYKAAFFQSLLNNESNQTSNKLIKNSTREETSNVTDNYSKNTSQTKEHGQIIDTESKNNTNILSLLSTIARINTTNNTSQTQTQTTEKLPLVKFPDHDVNFNHRNRDRNIFWSNVNTASQLPTTSERINSKYYASPVLHSHHGIFRKTLQESDKIINTRRWSNR